MEETVLPGESHRTSAIHWQTLLHNQCCIEYTSPWAGFELTTLMMIGTDCIGSCKSNNHITMTAPWYLMPVSIDISGLSII